MKRQRWPVLLRTFSNAAVSMVLLLMAVDGQQFHLLPPPNNPQALFPGPFNLFLICKSFLLKKIIIGRNLFLPSVIVWQADFSVNPMIESAVFQTSLNLLLLKIPMNNCKQTIQMDKRKRFYCCLKKSPLASFCSMISY